MSDYPMTYISYMVGKIPPVLAGYPDCIRILSEFPMGYFPRKHSLADIWNPVHTH